MRIPSVIILRKLHVRGMALYPFILLRDGAMKEDAVMMNHERIHHRQQLELLIIPFYVLYLLNYLLNRMQYRSHRDAYLNIVFEREAYAHERDIDYLNGRKMFSFLKFIRVT